MTDTLRVDGDRFWSRVETMGTIGRNAHGGLDRPAYSAAHLEACERFASWGRDLGAEVEIDAVGNVIATFTAVDEGAARLVIGSHLDTVPNGGRFDGALGVLAGLEAVHTVLDSGSPLPRPVQVIAFADEEGAHGAGTVGSRAMCFGLDEAALNVRKDPSSPTLAMSLERAGFDPQRVSEAVRDVANWAAFVEVHPEQGAILERKDTALAIVTSIVHSARLRIHIEGATNHAGTTPMTDRSDALVTAAGVIIDVRDWAVAQGEGTVATVGRLLVEPNAINVVPGLVTLSVDVRSPNGAVVDAMEPWLVERLRSSGGRCERIIRKQGADMNADVQAALSRSVATVTDSWTTLASGAGHDARTIAQAGVPTGMLFVPSQGGVSHSPDESSSREDCVLAVQALARFIVDDGAATVRPS